MTELSTKTETSTSQPSVSLEHNMETKPTSLENKVAKPTSGGISMEDLVSKSISRSAVEPPLINSDAPSMRYKFFECRNYGDENYDKCIRASQADQKGVTDLAPIRYPELVRNAANLEAALKSQLPSSFGGGRTDVNVKKASSLEEDRKIINKDLAVPAGSSRTCSPIPEGFKRNLNLPDKARTSMGSKSPSSAASFSGSMTKHFSSTRLGFDSSSQSPSSLSIAGSKMHSSTMDRKNPSNPFQPVIVKHEFQPAEGTKGIKQEVNFDQSDSNRQLLSSVSELGKSSLEFKGGLGLSESAASRSPSTSQEAEGYEKYKAGARTLSRPHPTLSSKKNSGSLPPSLPVGVAHPYPRASDGGSTSSHTKGSESKTSSTVSSVTSGNVNLCVHTGEDFCS